METQNTGNLLQESNKHTPGPWSFFERLTPSENHRGYTVLHEHQYEDPDDNSGTYVADVMPIDADGVEGEANARLIAASPTMYAYIGKKAEEGDADAASIIASIR